MSDRVKSSNLGLVAGLLFAAALLGGCAARVPAPVRDGTPPPSVTAIPAPESGVHIVRPGDTLMGLSRLYGISVRDLIAWNALPDPNQLTVGQQVRVVPPGEAVVQPITNAQPVEVRPVAPGSEVAGTPIKQAPKGGRQPYSDEAWAALQPRPVTPPPAPAVPPPNGESAPDTVWLWPASGTLIGTFDEATNKGLDIAGKPGDPVIASASGKVVYSGSGLRGYGKLVIIKHDANYLTAYAHNQQLLVKEGESVTKGQKIAELGSTDADRPKLHFEIRKQGRPVDPMKYLPAR
jgi:lipoprotein NlpD